jgi:hypothetical protein
LLLAATLVATALLTIGAAALLALLAAAATAAAATALLAFASAAIVVLATRHAALLGSLRALSGWAVPGPRSRILASAESSNAIHRQIIGIVPL